MKSFLQAVDILNEWLWRGVALLVLAMTVVALLQVFVRLALPVLGLEVSAPWTEEIARYCLTWAVMVGAGLACRGQAHLSIDFVAERVASRYGVQLKYVAILVCALLAALLLVLGGKLTLLGLSETSPVLGIPKFYVYGAIPVGAVLMLVNLVAFAAHFRIDQRHRSTGNVREGARP